MIRDVAAGLLEIIMPGPAAGPKPLPRDRSVPDPDRWFRKVRLCPRIELWLFRVQCLGVWQVRVHHLPEGLPATISGRRNPAWRFIAQYSLPIALPEGRVVKLVGRELLKLMVSLDDPTPPPADLFPA